MGCYRYTGNETWAELIEKITDTTENIWIFNLMKGLCLETIICSVMRSYNATRDAWLLRVHMVDHQRHRTFPEDVSFLTDGKDIVFDSADILTDMQVVPSTTSICFAKAVVGKLILVLEQYKALLMQE